MNSRIKELRKHLHLTQQQFADRIGVKRNTIANYEIGRNTPVDSVFSLICKEFNVSEKWLRTGEGEMFVPNANDEIEQIAKKYHLSNEMKAFIEKLVNTNRETQDALIKFMTETAATLKAATIDQPTTSPGEGIDNTDTDTASAETAYVKTLNTAQNMGSSASSTTGDTGERIRTASEE